jgi:plasmid stabilization system protein ParE
MTKGLKILADVADRDIPSIVTYHLPRSRAKAVAIVAEYDRIVSRLRENPLVCRLRPHGWRIAIFRSGAYALYYREMPDCWLVAGVFHAQRDPDWIQTQLLIRESRETGS